MFKVKEKNHIFKEKNHIFKRIAGGLGLRGGVWICLTGGEFWASGEG